MSSTDEQKTGGIGVFVVAMLMILGGLALWFIVYKASQQPAMCGGTVMDSGDLCRSGSSSQTKEEVEDNKGNGDFILIGLGGLLVVGGILGAIPDRKGRQNTPSTPARPADRAHMPAPLGHPAPAPHRAPVPALPPPPPAPEPVRASGYTAFRAPEPSTARTAAPAAPVVPSLADTKFDALPAVWTRWTVLAAALVAIGSDVGPRIVSASTATFEGRTGSGATLRRLPRNRAVLSGGATDHGPAQPLAGAPEWITHSVLNDRAHDGRLNFAYWWDGGHWYRGQSPDAALLSNAVPAVWTDGTVCETVAGLITHRPDDQVRQATSRLLNAATTGAVTRAHVEAVFGGGNLDVHRAYEQFVLAELAS
ncbi:hypothetical protein [Nocardia sp. NPDC057668]|uniref:hypothetical protein n=1 Tax=Nocardia sp. NPDC057668 TaxID=3346202 RepID=UPI00366AB700